MFKGQLVNFDLILIFYTRGTTFILLNSGILSILYYDISRMHTNFSFFCFKQVTFVVCGDSES